MGERIFTEILAHVLWTNFAQNEEYSTVKRAVTADDIPRWRTIILPTEKWSQHLSSNQHCDNLVKFSITMRLEVSLVYSFHSSDLVILPNPTHPRWFAARNGQHRHCFASNNARKTSVPHV